MQRMSAAMQRMIVRTFVEGIEGAVMAQIAKGLTGMQEAKTRAERSLSRMKDFKGRPVRHEVKLILDQTFQVGEKLADIERRVILATLDACGGNKTKAAETLGISRRSIYNKLAEYRMSDPVLRDAIPATPSELAEELGDEPAAQVA